MPYQIRSECQACRQGDEFVIGNWPEHLGVFPCRECRALVNIPVDTEKCPHCGQQSQPTALYDYSFAIPYFGGQAFGPLEPGPPCPKCSQAPLTFVNQAHLNMGMVVHNKSKARATWGRDYMEKAIFMNTAALVCVKEGLSLGKMFDYCSLDVPAGPLITGRISVAITADISIHVGMRAKFEPESFTGPHPNDAAIRDALFGQLSLRNEEGLEVRLFERAKTRPGPKKPWWQFW